ncbi:hypothetical protein ARMSODRAFT_1020214 [Armillaria solidipes]|uniref:Uncharacterized protein n=1 Tax=Armillaria solidipes TaxID=1076256 RepID=A0A2H3BKZ9_9AGAR|nr:hypothetical protein ARMSODRAFT_1020214 [Armillaria solidipes]
MGKKRKLSGLSDAKLSSAYDSLIELRKKLQYEVVDEQVEDVESAKTDQFEEQLDKLLSLMEPRLQTKSPHSQSFSFSNVTLEILEDHLCIKQAANLRLKSEHPARIEKTTDLGKDKLWSSNNLHRHLNGLETLVPQTSEANARPWIDAFFFRVSAMVPTGMRMVLNMEHTIPATVLHPTTSTTLAGQIDYSAVVAEENVILDDPLMSTVHQVLPTGFFVTVAEPGNLRDHVAQAVAEMYGCAKLLKKDFLRGALTDGHQWIFLILHLNSDGNGGSFKRSVTVHLSVSGLPGGPQEVAKPTADLIAGILSFWIEHSFDDLGQDDWFELVQPQSVKYGE